MRLFLLVGISFLLITPPLKAEGSASLESANQAAEQGHYDEAAAQFRALIATYGYSAPLCFNLGNAEAGRGNLGLAILQYERARSLDPRGRDIDRNLQATRAKAGLATDSYRWWQLALRALSIREWVALLDFWLGLIALAVVLQALSPWLRRRSPRGLPGLGRLIKGILFLAIPAFLFTGYVTLLAAPTRIEGVVIRSGVKLRLSPFDSAEVTGPIPEGELVTVEQKHLDFVRIEGRNRRYGWLKRGEIEPVIPGSF